MSLVHLGFVEMSSNENSTKEKKSNNSETKSSIIWVVGIIIAVFVFQMAFTFFGFSFVVISNPDPNSMYPTYFQGDVFLLHKADPEDINVGDVIVYDPGERDLIIHRVISIYKHNDGDSTRYFYRVKGDNPNSNSYLDQYILSLHTHLTR